MVCFVQFGLICKMHKREELYWPKKKAALSTNQKWIHIYSKWLSFGSKDELLLGGGIIWNGPWDSVRCVDGGRPIDLSVLIYWSFATRIYPGTRYVATAAIFLISWFMARIRQSYGHKFPHIYYMLKKFLHALMDHL